MRLKRILYVAGGSLLVALGTAGIFLPLLPTTPFLLLAAFLFARSSHRLHTWLVNHRYLGPYINAFRNKTGLTPTQKFRIGLSMTIVMGVSIYFAPIVTLKWGLAAGWLFWTMVLIRSKTADRISQSGT